MSNSPNNRIFATGADTLINDAGNTIQGAGQLGINNAGFALTLTNKGTINANQSGNILQVAPSNTVINTGTMEATNGGTLALIGAFINTGGLIQATGAGSFVDFSGSTITGGTLTTTGGGAIGNIGTATLDSVTISDGSTVTAINSSSTTLQNTITINPTGTLALSSTGSFTDLHINGTVELAGGGTLAMSNSPNNRIFATGTDTLINDAGNTIQGAGQLGINNSGFAFTLINNGVIDANQSATALQVAPTTTVMNNNLLEASNGGTLVLTGGAFNNAGTILGTGAGSVVELNGSTINGGTLTTASGGTIQNSGTATLNGVTISGGSTFTAVNSSSTTLIGTITDNGTIAQNSTGSFTDLHISGAVTLTGTGSLTLSDSPNNRVFATGLDTLTNDVNHTIQGGGQLGINNSGFAFALTNNGTIIANQTNPLQVAPGSVINNGTMQVILGSTMQVLSPFTQNAGKTQVDGTMLVSSGETVTGGTVLGTGTISGNISMTGGVMQPGGASTPGALVINGNYDSNAAFNELISGSGNGLLIVNGSSTLDSGAVLNIDLLGGFTPFNGETFILMDYFSGSGTFANAPTTGFQMDGFNWTIAYNLTDIVLDAGSPIGTPTPEPGTLVLLAIGLAGLSRQIRARGK
jgi:hypothetical protein